MYQEYMNPIFKALFENMSLENQQLYNNFNTDMQRLRKLKEDILIYCYEDEIVVENGEFKTLDKQIKENYTKRSFEDNHMAVYLREESSQLSFFSEYPHDKDYYFTISYVKQYAQDHNENLSFGIMHKEDLNSNSFIVSFDMQSHYEFFLATTKNNLKIDVNTVFPSNYDGYFKDTPFYKFNIIPTIESLFSGVDFFKEPLLLLHDIDVDQDSFLSSIYESAKELQKIKKTLKKSPKP